MSTAAQTATTTTTAAAAKGVPGWKQLARLLPYMARYKGQVLLGLATDGIMGLIGALQPLALGIIIDCVSGQARPLGRLYDTMPRLSQWLSIAYRPSDRRTLAIYCIAALIIVAL